MEKVTFKPLVELLKRESENLNQTLKSFRTTCGNLDTEKIPVWFKEVIEPVFIEVNAVDADKSMRVFRELYRFMLQQLVSRADDRRARSCALLLKENPRLAAAHSSKLLSQLFLAQSRIEKHSQSAANEWLSVMGQIMPLTDDMNELLAAGRVAAWRCGMAHLRGLICDTEKVCKQIQKIIFSDQNIDLKENFKRWSSKDETEPLAVGGFTGLDGQFCYPPMVALDGEKLFAFDGQKFAVLFVDRFGAVFHDCPPHLKENLRFNKKRPANIPAKAREIIKSYNDLTSWVYHDSTLYLTLASSHSIFVFGAIDG